jgi:phage shock protein C
MARKAFRIDKGNGKLMGVCAGLANYTGVDVTLVRVGVVLVTLLGAFPWTLIAYGVAAWVAKPKRSRFAEADAVPARRVSAKDVRDSMTDIDRRMIAIDAYVAGADSRLSREIEELR